MLNAAAGVSWIIPCAEIGFAILAADVFQAYCPLLKIQFGEDVMPYAIGVYVICHSNCNGCHGFSVQAPIAPTGAMFESLDGSLIAAAIAATSVLPIASATIVALFGSTKNHSTTSEATSAEVHGTPATPDTSGCGTSRDVV